MAVNLAEYLGNGFPRDGWSLCPPDEGDHEYVYWLVEMEKANLRGYFTASELRAIADHMDHFAARYPKFPKPDANKDTTP